MRVHAPAAGEIEWRCAPGDEVRAGQTLGWIAGPDRCGLVPVVSRASGKLTFRRTPLLTRVEASEVVAAIGEADVSAELQRERELLAEEAARLSADETPGARSPLAAALLGREEELRRARREALEWQLRRGDH